MTEFSQASFEFAAHVWRAVVADFDGGTLSGDGGALLLPQTDRRIGPLPRLAACFTDLRAQERIEHGVEQVLVQRLYGLALGYEDLNDHDQLRRDPLMGVLAGRGEPESALASKSTLCRLERTTATATPAERNKKIHYDAEVVDHLLVDVFLEAHTAAPREVIIDLDATDTPLHGRQEGRFFHGYYDHYCYLPLHIFCGDQLPCTRLREADLEARAGSLEEILRIAAQIRKRWRQVRIGLRADSGFSREEMVRWCEDNHVDYVFDLACNERLRALSAKAMRKAAAECTRTGKPGRVFTEFGYRARKSWSRARRVVAKAERSAGKENPRYVVTSLNPEPGRPQELYAQLYCARGEMENRIKEQMILSAGRMSAETMRANQLRLYLSAMAYVLVEAFRRLALTSTEMARAQVHTVRLRLLKVGAHIRFSVRRVLVSMSNCSPWRGQFAHAWAALRC